MSRGAGACPELNWVWFEEAAVMVSMVPGPGRDRGDVAIPHRGVTGP